MSRAPLLHVLGAGPWQLPTIRHARALGCRVLVTDGLADRPGFGLADLHAVADLTDAEATLAVARRHAVDGVLCDTTDTGVLTAAIVADALGLPGVGVDAARRCTDKARMTEAAAAAGLPTPATRLAASAEDARAAVRAMAGPWVIKPVDAQAGKGVGLVADAADADDAIAHAFAHSRSRRVIVQQRLSGPEVIVDALVVDGQPRVLGVAGKTPYPDHPAVSSRITYPPDPDLAPWPLVEATLGALVRALGIRCSLVHAEFIVGDGRLVPIDVAARGGGVMIYPTVLGHLTGADVMTAAIRIALGCYPGLPDRPAGPPGRAANIEFLRAPAGVLRRVDGLDEARRQPGVAAVHLNLLPGDSAGDLRHKDRRLGYVVTLADSAAAAVAAGERAAALIGVDVDAFAGAAPQLLGSTS